MTDGRNQGMMIGSAVSIIILFIVVIMGATSIQRIRTNELTSASTASQLDTNNPSRLNTSSNGGVINFAYPAQFTANLNPRASSIVVSNSTTGVVYEAENYTSTAQNITWTAAFANQTLANISFTVTIDQLNYDYNISTRGLAGLVTYADFFSVIVVVIVFAIIIGLFVAFAGRPGRGSNI